MFYTRIAPLGLWVGQVENLDLSGKPGLRELRVRWSGRLGPLTGGGTPPLPENRWIFNIWQLALFEDNHLAHGGIVACA